MTNTLICRVCKESASGEIREKSLNGGFRLRWVAGGDRFYVTDKTGTLCAECVELGVELLGIEPEADEPEKPLLH